MDVVVYGIAEDDPPPCSEYVGCYPEQGPQPFTPDRWRRANNAAVAAIAERMRPDDLLGIIGGTAQRKVATSLPELRAVEYRVAYGGTFTQHRVFETVAWQHVVYGAQSGGDPHAADGFFYDTVIPPPFEVEDFPAPLERPADFLLYCGRLIERKGVQVAVETAERVGLPLVVAGEGDFRFGEGNDGVTYVGHVGPEDRAALMGAARAILVPTLYVEPGGGVAIEAQLCGTPAITTPWGCFTETVEDGVSGFRCHRLSEFCDAVERAGGLDRVAIRERARSLYSLEAIAPQYDRFFDHLSTLNGAGFYA